MSDGGEEFNFEDEGQNPGEVLQLADEGFDSEEEDQPEASDDDEAQAAANRPMGQPAPIKSDIKAQAVDNQHHDLAVSVNDSEEVDSEEEDDVHAMQQQQQLQPNMQQQQQKVASSQA